MNFIPIITIILPLRHKPCYVFQRLVVCLEESIYIHNIKDMKLLKTLLNTPSNSSGKVESAGWRTAIRPIKRIEKHVSKQQAVMA